MGRMQAQSTSCNSDLSETAAAAALLGDQNVVADLRRVLQENRDALLAEVAKIPNVRVQKPQGTFYSFIDFSHYNADSNAISRPGPRLKDAAIELYHFLNDDEAEEAPAA